MAWIPIKLTRMQEDLPGGRMMGVCTVRMPWPEEVARKGIEPHICVEPTLDDVIRNEDRVLQTAVRYLRSDKAVRGDAT